MAAPVKDTRTGIYQYRRVVPEPLRPWFDGGRREFKRSLDTRDPEEARSRSPAQALIYEQMAAAAKRLLESHQLRSAAQMVDAFLDGVDDDALRGIAAKLASLELDAFAHTGGGEGWLPGARYDFGAAPGKADLTDHASRKAMLEAVSDLRPLPWLETLRRIEALPSLDPVDWAIAAVAFHAGVEAAPGTPLHQAIGRAYLDRLCAACAVRVEPSRMRIVPAPIIVQSNPNGAVPVVTPPASVQKPSVPTITEVFDAWSTFEKREPKLVDEWRTAVGRFVALNGDLRVDEITATMVRDYRRTPIAGAQ